mmetsp:Transcript_60072/g.106710  ORF Transcript_60072/g.106710 Transcript_60072/m.106710 type:complete len:89 (-) Transcript_60072:123-389(-)
MRSTFHMSASLQIGQSIQILGGGRALPMLCTMEGLPSPNAQCLSQCRRIPSHGYARTLQVWSIKGQSESVGRSPVVLGKPTCSSFGLR